MDPEKAQKLINVYPELFSDLHEKNNMRLFGFECGDGWFELLEDLIGKIREHGDKKIFSDSFDDPIELKVDQIKEKYGTLSFYMNITDTEIDELIEEAERKSAVTCEECGKSGSMRAQRRWYSVRCDECWDAIKSC
jgi:hypothetical protein